MNRELREEKVLEDQLAVDVEQPRPLWKVYLGMLFDRASAWDPSEKLPVIVYRQSGVKASAEDVASYRLVCGESPPGVLPPMYVHILATPLQMNLMESDDFPLPLAGLVHLDQEIEWHRDIPVDASLDLACKVEGPEEVDAGWEFRLTTEALLDGHLAWREIVTFLKLDLSRRARPRRRARGEGDAMHFVPLLHMQFPEDTGRRYARVSGDWNPIHLWPFLSKRFGYRRPIAHGMFTLARCLSVVQARGVDLNGRRLKASFKAPVMLPAFTNFCLNDKHPESHFALTDARKGRILVEGEIESL